MAPAGGIRDPLGTFQMASLNPMGIFYEILHGALGWRENENILALIIQTTT